VIKAENEIATIDVIHFDTIT